MSPLPTTQHLRMGATLRASAALSFLRGGEVCDGRSAYRSSFLASAVFCCSCCGSSFLSAVASVSTLTLITSGSWSLASSVVVFYTHYHTQHR